MKHLFSALLGSVLMLAPVAAQACDICGCAAGSAQTGILALTQRHLTGLRWQSQQFRSRPHGSGEGTSEHFQSAEWWGRWQVNSRWQVSAIVPFQMNRRQVGDQPFTHINGLGDISFWGHFSVFSAQKQAKRLWQHTLLLNAGVKLPTGKTDRKDQSEVVLHPNMQPGTGSTDGLASAIYVLKRRQWGISAEQSMRRTTTSDTGYRFGSRSSSTLRVFRTQNWANALLVPQLSLTREHSGKDYDNGDRLGESGGKVHYAAIGLDCFYKKMAMNISMQYPVLHTLAQGYVTPYTRWNAGVAILLGKTRKQAMTIPLPVPAEDLY